MTTDAGISVASDEYSLIVGPAGPNLFESARHLLIPDPLPERVLELPGAVSRRRAYVRGRAAVLGGAGGRLVRK
jgi:hypothetical protein